MTTSTPPVPASTGAGTVCCAGDPDDRVVDLVAAWAPGLAAQAEVLAALFGDELGRQPAEVVREQVGCGSYRAYKQHLRLGEQTCTKCRAANAERRRAAYIGRDARVRRERPAAQKRPPCGTNAAYCQHLYYGEFPVDPKCLAAHSAYETKKAADRRTRIPT